MKNQVLKFLFLLLTWGGLLLWGQLAPASSNPNETANLAIEKIEKAILQASELQEQGKLQKGRPLVVPIASDLRLVFTAENFNDDLNRAFQILDQMMTRAKASRTKPLPAPAAPPAVTPAQPPPPDRLSALRESEKQTARSAPPGTEPHLAMEYSVYKNYRQTRQSRMQEDEKLVEVERQAVVAERQVAAQNQQRKRERDQQLQAQATAWQAELDKQAKASSAAALQWEQEHSFGAYVKRFLGVVVQTSVGAFTGGFLGTLSTNLANQAVGNLFPSASTNVYSQAAAAGTSAAITQTGTNLGQSVGQQAASTVTGSSSGTTQPMTSTGMGQLQYAPPKF